MNEATVQEKDDKSLNLPKNKMTEDIEGKRFEPEQEQTNIWELGNKIIVFAWGGAFLGGLLAQLPGTIIGAIITVIYVIVTKPENKEAAIESENDILNQNTSK